MLEYRGSSQSHVENRFPSVDYWNLKQTGCYGAKQEMEGWNSAAQPAQLSLTGKHLIYPSE